MNILALIPFCVLFASFALFRIPLVYSAFIALLSCTAIAGASVAALQNSLFFLIEIGLIIVGAFYFIEVAEHRGVIDSLASLVKEVSKNRIIQSLLVAFPLCMMVEGSSGFGTPLLIIAPILRALGLPLLICALLPLINMIDGIPFGALGTPIRLGFSSATDFVLPIASQTIASLYPLFFATPLVSYLLVRKKIRAHSSEKNPIWIIWTVCLSSIYTVVAYQVSLSNVEFPALAGGLVTFVFGIFSAHFIENRKWLIPIHRRGLFIYTFLLLTLWAGKMIWMDEKIPGTPLRIFNPGWVFLIFGWAISRSNRFFVPALNRSRRTIAVLFSMTFIVQQLKISGSIQKLLETTPTWLLQDGTPLLGWLSSYLIGTGTIANLFIAPLIDENHFGVLAAGTALGVPLAFQSIIGVKSILKDQVTEREILTYFFPISVAFLTLSLLLRH